MLYVGMKNRKEIGNTYIHSTVWKKGTHHYVSGTERHGFQNHHIYTGTML
jgi:hypothetical protein